MYISLPICALTRRRYRKTPPLSSAPFTRHPCSWLGIALRVGRPVCFVSQENPRASAWKHLRQRTDGAVISDNCEHVFPPTVSVCVCALLAIQTSAPVDYTPLAVYLYECESEKERERRRKCMCLCSFQAYLLLWVRPMESSWIKSTGKRATGPSLNALGSKWVQQSVDRSSLVTLISEQYSRIPYYDENLNADESDCSENSTYGRLSVKRHWRGPRVRDDDELMERMKELNCLSWNGSNI